MSNKSIFAVLDAAAGTFGNLIVVPHVGVAVRAFTDQVNNPDRDNNFYHHPQDFALYEVGSYDDTQGVITPLPLPKLITQATSVKHPIN